MVIMQFHKKLSFGGFVQRNRFKTLYFIKNVWKISRIFKILNTKADTEGISKFAKIDVFRAPKNKTEIE
jgi:hypothetical protein